MSVRSILLRMFLAAEADAISGYTTYEDGKWVFNDRIWREEDSQFRLFREARTFLGLKPYSYSGKNFPREGRTHIKKLDPE